MYRTNTKLIAAVNKVNRRYSEGKNNDDAVFDMVQIDEKTKGFSFISSWDEYKVVTDFSKLEAIAEKFGYWSNEVQQFNEKLKSKGGVTYMREMNDRYKYQLETV